MSKSQFVYNKGRVYTLYEGATVIFEKELVVIFRH